MNAANRYFVDTNILLYVLDAKSPVKQRVCRNWMDHLWEHNEGRISWQVLHEFYANAVRKMGVPVDLVRASVQTYILWQPVETTPGLLQRAWHWMDEAQLAYWDALIVAAAERCGCQVLLSEDFSHGRRFGTVLVANPFEQPAGGHVSYSKDAKQPEDIHD